MSTRPQVPSLSLPSDSNPSATIAEAALAQEIATYMQAHHETRQFMGTVNVVCGDQVIFKQSYGMACLEHQVPNTPQTKFRVGSVTKQFTAAAILQLQDRGMLDVHATLDTYLPTYPHGDRLTLHQLLTHTTGLPNLTSFPDYHEWMKLPSDLDTLIARFQDLPLRFTPGTQYHYSNSNYVLLTKVLETVSGQPYAEYLAHHLLAPLGMTNTGYEQPLAIVPGLAQGYQITANGYQRAEFIDMTTPQGAGGLYSTGDDLIRWHQFLFNADHRNEAILSDRAIKTMTSPQVSLGIAAEPSLSYGYGLVIQEQGDQSRIGHGGGINGFVSSLVSLPTQAITIGVLSNVESINPEQISADLAAILLGNPYTVPQAIATVSVDPAQLDRYVGTYQLMPQFQITVTVAAGQLFVQGTGQPKVGLFPTSTTEFIAHAPALQIHFSPNTDGSVDQLILIQAGQTTIAPRVSPY